MIRGLFTIAVRITGQPSLLAPDFPSAPGSTWTFAGVTAVAPGAFTTPGGGTAGGGGGARIGGGTAAAAGAWTSSTTSTSNPPSTISTQNTTTSNPSEKT